MRYYNTVTEACRIEGVVFTDLPDSATWVAAPGWGETPADMREELTMAGLDGPSITPTPATWDDGRPYNGLVGWVVGLS